MTLCKMSGGAAISALFIFSSVVLVSAASAGGEEHFQPLQHSDASHSLANTVGFSAAPDDHARFKRKASSKEEAVEEEGEIHVHVVSWRWDHMGVYVTITLFIVLSGLAKVGEQLGQRTFTHGKYTRFLFQPSITFTGFLHECLNHGE